MSSPLSRASRARSTPTTPASSRSRLRLQSRRPPRPRLGADGGRRAACSRPTLADLGQRGLRWGALLVSALAGAAVLGAAAWFARLVSAALVREDWIGWATLVLLLVAAFAALMLLLRELVGFSRLNRLNRIRADVTKALAERDHSRRRASLRLAGLSLAGPSSPGGARMSRSRARRARCGRCARTRRPRAGDAARPRRAARHRRSAKRVATVTAMSPRALIAVLSCCRESALLRSLATLYGGRPGFSGSFGSRTWWSATSSPPAASP